MEDLYSNLLALCENTDTPFFFSDQELDGQHYKIFSYHFTDKDSWLLPDALEARGIMFQVDPEGGLLRLAARPMPKFFNRAEVDFVQHGVPEYIMNKADGSLISSYTDAENQVRLKSKTSIHSDHAKLAMELMDDEPRLKAFVKDCEDRGYTVNMELVSPDPKFRIVLYYDKPKLIVLNARNHVSGEYMPMELMPKAYFAGFVPADHLSRLHEDTNVEGYVVIDENGTWWKEKTAWYLARHRAKDFVNNGKAFIELVLKDEADDVFALIADQPAVLKEMQDLQHKVIQFANTLVNEVTAYWEANKDMDRKDYAIKGKTELGPMEFAMAMKYYANGEEPNWKKYLLDQVKKIDW
jgi:T4 RnlA family RNA ligase